MEAKPNTELTPELPPDGAAASLILPGDDAPSLKTFSLDSYAEDEQAHARCLSRCWRIHAITVHEFKLRSAAVTPLDTQPAPRRK